MYIIFEQLVMTTKETTPIKYPFHDERGKQQPWDSGQKLLSMKNQLTPFLYYVNKIVVKYKHHVSNFEPPPKLLMCKKAPVYFRCQFAQQNSFEKFFIPVIFPIPQQKVKNRHLQLNFYEQKNF